MKIGIVTVYDAMNYGGFLQAYALKCFLEQKGHSVFFLRRANRRRKERYAIMMQIVFRKSVSIRGIMAGRERFRAFEGTTKYLQEVDTVEGMDLVVVGSDTLWDVGRPKFRDSIFYGCFKHDVPVVSYAASCSESTEEDFLKYSNLTDNIRNFKHITVRDVHTKKVIENALGVDAKLVCDPTLLVEESLWNVHDIGIDLSDTILVYAYDLPLGIIEHLRRYKGENGLRLISLCIFHPWCDAHITCLPLEFPSYLKQAKHVVTNTFHGTIFSIITESNLISVKRGNKLRNLIEDLLGKEIGLDAKCTYDEFLDMVSRKMNFNYVKNRVAESRVKSARELMDVLD